MSNQLRLRPDDARAPAVTNGEQPAELVDDVVGIEPDRAGIVADEGPGKDAGGPPREVVPLEAVPEIHADLGDERDGSKTDVAPLAFAA